MDRDVLFLRTLDDLRSRTAAGSDDYDAVMSAGLLRKLLINGAPLVHEVNRERREQIRFQVTQEDAYTEMVLADGPIFWALLEGISPRLGVRRHSEEAVTLDGLLGKRAARVQGHDVTVRDLIAQVAHIDGGVHVGRPKSEVERALSEASAAIQIGGMPAIARTMRGIAAVVLDGLAPLEARVRSDVAAD